jgi:chromosome segregation ATPase
MASQQLAKSTGSQDRVHAKVRGRQVAGPSQLRANMGNEAGNSSDTRHEPHTLGQHIIGIEKKLFEAVGMIEDSRRGLHDCRPAVNALARKCEGYEQACSEDQRRLAEYVQAYNELRAQYHQTVDNLNDMTGKLVSLHGELEETQNVKRSLESKIQEYEGSLGHKAIPDQNRDNEASQLDWNTMLHGITNNEQVEAKNEQLIAQNKQLAAENERLTAQNEQLAAKNEQLTAQSEQLAAENERLAAQNKQFAAKNLEFEKTLINAANHIDAAEQKISELEDMHQTLQLQASAPADSSVSPEPKQSYLGEGGPATTVRKRRRGAQ